MLDTIFSGLLGAFTGFLTSLYFWRKSQRKDRPRLYIKVRSIDQVNGETIFDIENEGMTHAISVSFDDASLEGISKDFAPKAKEQLCVLTEDETAEYVVSYKDVWGTSYEAQWRLSGAHKFELEGGDSLYDFAQTEKVYEYAGSNRILRLRTRLLRKGIHNL
jgi:hypothetical protein